MLVLIGSACSQSTLSANGSETSSGEPATGSNADLLGDSDSSIAPAETAEESGDSSEDDVDRSSTLTFEPAPAGYLVWAHAVEPIGLSIIDPVDGGLYTTAWIREGLLEGLYRVDSEWEQIPELLADDASVVVNSNKTVSITYRLRPGLTWSDGEPLTAADVEYTHRILMEGCLKEADGSTIDVSNEGCVYPMSDRTGYDLVTSFAVADDVTFTVSMAAFYPDWRSLYSQIFAAHAFGDDASTVAANLVTMTARGQPLPSSGPLVWQDWGDHSMRLRVNENYHGSAVVDEAVEGSGIAGVQINFVPDTGTAVAEVAAGAADLAIVGSDLDMLASLDPLVTAVGLPAVEFEHLGLNLLNPHLSDPLIRQAVVRAMDRTDLAAVYGDLVGQGVSAEGVGNMFWLPGQSGYRDHQPEAVTADPTGAVELIEEAGYLRTGDGSYRHPERGTLFLRFLTNSGDSVRLALQAELTDQLTAAGFEIRTDNRNGGAYLTEGPFSSEAMEASGSGGANGRPDIWDMVLFAWAGGPWPGLQSGAFRANSGANPYGYDNPEFDAESSRCDGLADDVERAACYQELDTFVTTLERGEDGLFVVPLVERPQVLVYNSERLSGVPSIVDGSTGGPLPDVLGFSLR
ncbi:MAG: ABC transporter substrate-binding protein [Acidimicrobiia bacterium]|nr:ABC transporter substrate-binding protein [Acidimicrobiia bacterium]